jgi:thiol-disulfide isomerase/thioredoxin
MKNKSWIYITIFVLAIAGLISWYNTAPGPHDSFAQCLKDSGAKFYGAFWCPHCIDQKKIFGKSAKRLPYIECSTPDGNGQKSECKEANIEGYPTWEFKGGARESRVFSIEELAATTSCAFIKQ